MLLAVIFMLPKINENKKLGSFTTVPQGSSTVKLGIKNFKLFLLTVFADFFQNIIQLLSNGYKNAENFVRKSFLCNFISMLS